MQLFFGYIEFYTSLLAMIFIFVLTSILYLKDKCPITYPSFAYGVMVCIHVSAVWLMPSLLALYLLKIEKKVDILKFFKAVLAFAIPTVLLFGHILFFESKTSDDLLINIRNFVSGLKGSDPILILPLEEALSLQHIEEMLNELILIAPAGLVLCVFLFIFKWNRIELKDKILTFLIVTTTCYMAYTWTKVTGLGLPQDWDVLAPVGFLYTLLGAYLLIKTVRDENLLIYYAVLLIVIPMLIHTAPLILSNAWL